MATLLKVKLSQKTNLTRTRLVSLVTYLNLLYETDFPENKPDLLK